MIRLLKTVVFLGSLALAGVLAATRLLSPRRALAAAPVTAAPDVQAVRAGTERHWVKIAALLAACAAGGFLVLVSGIVPIKASSGHWPITAWFLHFAMRRSIATHTLGLKTPPLDDPSLVLQGAGHYETGCRPCHGSPDMPHPRIPQQMTPHPPALPPVIAKWEPRELFYIVKHGVKFTGMPAWPALQRDDEVWAMVAFLLTLPELDAAAYQRLVHGEHTTTDVDAPIHDMLAPAQVPQAVTESCGRCHGIDGRSRGTDAFPRLAGQRPAYLYAALQAFARGERHSGMMEPIAAALSPTAMRELARYYSGMVNPSPSSPQPQITPAIERGKAIASRGIPSQRVPSCEDCHGPGRTRRNPIYPSLAGQYADYLVLQLELFAKGHRGGSAYAHLMHPIAAHLNSEQRRDVALYYESLTATPDSLEP